MSGRATSGGVVFQSEVGAYVAALLLSERPLSRLSDTLPGKPLKIFMETQSAVDDVNIVTDEGMVYVQAKTNLSVSENIKSEFYSVVDQFVRQYRDGVTNLLTKRQMDTYKDRLVLAVGENAPSTVRNDLRIALDRNRTGAATALPANLKNPLETMTKVIQAVWLQESGIAISDQDLRNILIMSAVVVLDVSQKKLSTEALSHIVKNPGEEVILEKLLVNWAAGAAEHGTGGDRNAILGYLQGKIRLKEPPSYQADVMKLSEYCDRILSRLERFTKINTEAGEITFNRSVSPIVLAAAKCGSLAITGDPGSGKSAIIYNLSRELRADAVVVTLTLENNIITLDSLQKEIGLEHPLVDVLKNIPIESNCYLVIDALDSTRGGPAESSYKKLVQEVSQLDGWKVIASVRTFDLKLGLEWRKLFRGTAPDLVYAEDTFRAVRHVHVPLLSEAEIEEIENKSPSLKIALGAAGSKMAILAKNPFNLSLIGELIHSGADPSSLSSVATRTGLLSTYWTERMEDIGLQGKKAMQIYINLLLSSHSIDIPEISIPMEATEVVDKLQSRGVLVTEQSNRIAFRHHILFDYAVSKLILEPDYSTAMTRLSKSEGTGLLIAPSLEYWLEHLKNSLSSEIYWKLICTLISSEQNDPVIRIEVARIAVQSVEQGQDLSALSVLLSGPDINHKKAITQLAGTLTTFNVTSANAESWAKVIAGIKSISEPYQLGNIKVIISVLLEVSLSPTTLSALGKVSRDMFDEISKNEHLIDWLSPTVISFVVKTYASNPAASKQRLELLFEEQRFQKFGYIEIPALSRVAMTLSEQDEDLLARLYKQVFAGGDFSREHKTALGSQSWIMSLNSNAAQDFDMARYELSSNFLRLLQASPVAGIKAMGASIEGQKRKWSSKSEVEYNVAYNSGHNAFKEDQDFFWIYDRGSEYLEEDNIYQIFMKWLPGAEPSLIDDIPNLLLEQSSKAMVWRIIFEIGILYPKHLGKKLLESATDPVVISSTTTRSRAIRLIAATYPHLSKDQKEKVELKILNSDFEFTGEPAYFTKIIISELFEGIGKANLVSPQSREFLEDKEKEQRALEEHIDVVQTEEAPVTMDKTPKKDTTEVEHESLSSVSQHIQILLSDQPGADPAVALWPMVTKLQVLVEARNGGSSELGASEAIMLIKGIAEALASDWVPAEEIDGAISRLITLSYHSSPSTNERTEEDFSRFPTWGGHSVRVDAAVAIGKLTAMAELWPKISERYKKLLFEDPHPAVRMQAIICILGLWNHDRDGLWEIAEKFLKTEENSSVLGYGSLVLCRLQRVVPEQLEPLILGLLSKKVSAINNNNTITSAISYFAVVKELPASKMVLEHWIQNFKDNEKNIHDTLVSLRNYLGIGYAIGTEQKTFIRKNVIVFLHELTKMLEPVISGWTFNRAATDGEIISVNLISTISSQIYFAFAYQDGIVLPLNEQRALLTDYAPLVSKLSTLGTPKTVYEQLQLLERFVEADPNLCFDLISEAVLRKTGVAKYEHEPMGATLFVKLVGLFLADYSYIFSDSKRRSNLIDCLALFVDAGWPEARRIFKELQDLR